MIAAGIGLIAMAFGGVVAGGLTREVRDTQRLMRGVVATVTAAAVGGLFFAMGFTDILLVATLATIPLIVGEVLRRWIADTSFRAWAGLIVEFECLMVLGISSATIGVDGEWLRSLLLSLPYGGLEGMSAGTVVLVLGVTLWLGPVGNAVVRMVLAGAGADTGISEKRLRGGRVIGILERWLIFGFVVSGHPTAAAFIVSAKSILRFPELSERARGDIADGNRDELDSITEYLLLGSLASWTVAVLPVVFFR